MSFSMRLFALFALTLTLVQCAHVEPPSGGKVDKTPPQVKGVYPARGQTNISPNSGIKILFTEWMQEKLGPADVQISPPLSKGVITEMIGPELRIIPRSPLDSGITYNLILSRELSDLRGNSLDLPFNLSFSTGPNIDSTTLKGTVYSDGFNKASKSSKIALYPIGAQKRNGYSFLKELAIRDSITIDSLPRLDREFPLYVTSPDSAGNFEFIGLSKGVYYIAAFADQNQNGVINADREATALYPYAIDLSESKELKYPLVLSQLDDSKFYAEGFEAVGSNLLLINFNKPLDSISYNASISFNDSLQNHTMTSRQFLRLDESSLVLQIDSIRDSINYTIDLSEIKSLYGEALDSNQLEIPLTWQNFNSNQVNKINSSSVKNGSILADNQNYIDIEYSLELSESNSTDSIFILGLSDTSYIAPKSINPFTTRITLPADLAKSSSYQIIKKIPPSDSLPDGVLKRLLFFKTADPLKIGSIKLSTTLSNTIGVKIKSLESSYQDSLFIKPEEKVSRSSIPEGSVVVQYYIDLNSNNKRDKGSVSPYLPSEPIQLLKDTLVVPRNDTLSIIIE
jgi:hypothetical protein